MGKKDAKSVIKEEKPSSSSEKNTNLKNTEPIIQPKKPMTVPLDGLLAITLLAVLATLLSILLIDNEVLDDLRWHLKINTNFGRTEKIGNDFLLRYYNVRGEAEPIRLALIEAGVKFKEEIPKKTSIPDLVNSGAYFGELPQALVTMNNEKISIVSTGAILRYIARNARLYGKNSKEMLQCDMVAEGAESFRKEYENFVHSPDSEKNKDQYVKTTAKRWFAYLDNWLINTGAYFGKGKYFVGDDITFVDFMIYDLIDIHLQLNSEFLEETPLLKSFYDRIGSRPKIEKYVNGDKKRKQRPINLEKKII